MRAGGFEAVVVDELQVGGEAHLDPMAELAAQKRASRD